ncbi:MAG TPA: Gfo/Idh/MocA family oxidoreductase [Chitinophagaceae bacterium]
MKKINWGIIGCGDVTEVKSGPAFNKVKNSSLVAVMRRDAAKAEDYARRHQVPKWYNDAARLINDPDVNAVYVATPPSSHEEYTIAALKAGKPVYVEKPMSVNSASAIRMANAAKETNQKLSVAHYRRAMPYFKAIKQLIEDKVIGNIRLARLSLYKKIFSPDDMNDPSKGWRVKKDIGGGGIFHDLSPHQLDLVYYFFGEPGKVTGVSANQANIYDADDIVAGNILFGSGVVFDGVWCVNTAAGDERDHCEIIGEKGKISFSFFDYKPVEVTVDGKTRSMVFDTLPHVQQPMIEKVVEYFLDEGANPCSGEEGVKVMRLIDQFTGK